MPAGDEMRRLLFVFAPAAIAVAALTGCALPPAKRCVATAIPPGGSITCTTTLTSALGAGAAVTDAVISPSSARVSSCRLPTGGLVCGESDANTVQLTCPSGCAAGATFTLTIVAFDSGPLVESLTQPPPPPFPGGPQSFTVTPAPAVIYLPGPNPFGAPSATPGT
jgi:hypothetical protein